MSFKSKLIELLAKETKLKTQEVENLLSIPPDQKLGDYAFPCFKLGGNPKEAADKLKEQLKLPDFIEKVETAGPYLNFYLNKAALAKEVLTKIQKEKANYGSSKNKRKVVIEYCGPNTNKPLHLGHVRNMALGSSVVKILSFIGNDVKPVNIINDRGVHICKSMLAYQKWGKNQEPDKKSDHFVGDWYVRFAKEEKKNPDLKDEIQQMLVKWEAKDKATRALWKKMNEWVLAGHDQTYERFDVSFDKAYYESNHYELGKDVALEGLQKGVFIKDERGAILAELEQYKISDKVVLRSDGTSIYITQDMYLAQERYQDYNYDEMIYVVASEQREHFRQLFKILELLKRPFAGSLYHLSYGLVNLPNGRMKSREGTVVDADDILDEMHAVALKEVEKRYTDLSDEEKNKRAELIGTGAVKFFMLRTDAVREMIFDPEESISFEGETAPYIQYTHARACSILRKAELDLKKVDYTNLAQAQEHALVMQLSKFSESVQESAKHYKPHIICRYLIDLAQQFNEFYHAHKVLVDDGELSKARLALVSATKQVIANGLSLLGIVAPQEM